MANREIEIGPVGRRVADNVAAFRKRRQLRQQDLAARVEAAGRPMTASAISKIEQYDRRVDVDDLVALALSLRVTPNRLLLTGSADQAAEVALTPTVVVTEKDSWWWATGDSDFNVRAPLPENDPELTEHERQREQRMAAYATMTREEISAADQEYARNSPTLNGEWGRENRPHRLPGGVSLNQLATHVGHLLEVYQAVVAFEEAAGLNREQVMEAFVLAQMLREHGDGR